MTKKELFSGSRAIYWRVTLIALLILLLQIPAQQISSLIEERAVVREKAISEIERATGGAQMISGPVIAVPYPATDGRMQPIGSGDSRRMIYLLPDSLDIKGEVIVEKLKRGIYETPVYTAKLELSGSFSLSKLVSHFRKETALSTDDLAQATLSLGIADPRTITENVRVVWQGQELLAQSKSANPFSLAGIHADLPDNLESSLGNSDTSGAEQRVPFTIGLTLRGSSNLELMAIGNHTTASLRSNWPHPGFAGDILPAQREVSADGFEASWEVGKFGRSFGEVVEILPKQTSNSLMSVQFVSPVNIHTMCSRAVKYELLLVTLCFVTYFVFEHLVGKTIHAVQYGMVGTALILFYLTLLSLSEHLGFSLAYMSAACCSFGLVTCYSKSVLGNWSRASVIGALLAIQYLFFYILLREEDYALVFGSFGLTVVLALVMYVTRNINWSNFGARTSCDSQVLESV